MTDPFASPVPGEPSAAASPPPSSAPLYGAPLYGAPLVTTRNGLGTAALVLGILGIIPFTLLLLPAVLGIVFGIVGRRRAKRGEATNGGTALAGIICGSVGLVLGLLAITALVLFATSDSGKRLQDCLNAADNNVQLQQVCKDRFSNDLLGR